MDWVRNYGCVIVPLMANVIFPLPIPAADPYWEKNQTSFDWLRDGGNRRHAGVDLVAKANTPVLAMADGVVLRISKSFYQGTGAVEVQHPGIGIVRYGEIDRLKIAIVVHQKVKQGDTIAFVGQRIGSHRFMLHLELYSNWLQTDTNPLDEASHPLSDTTNPPYQRRSDVENPTELLRRAPIQSLQNVTFNSSHHLDGTYRLKTLLRSVVFPSVKFVGQR